MSYRIVLVTLLAVSSAQADSIYVDDDNCPGPGAGGPWGHCGICCWRVC